MAQSATTVYENMVIRKAGEKDIQALYLVAGEMKAVHEERYFERCFSEQQEGRRVIFLAENQGRPQGYAQLIWSPLYPPFRRLNIPEIQDLNVVPSARRQGLGAKLVAACEDEARQAGTSEMGISVGLHARFGAAQRLYVRLGYVPDGAGVMHDEVPVAVGELRPVDDLLTLKLIKPL